MAVMTYDGQSFMLDGRRIWLVAGTIEYTRLPRASWRSRLMLAKHAGLNTITTSVVWSKHEPRAGAFTFDGDLDLRHFLELVREAGLLAILRMGPFVGGSFDMGGLPPWLLANPNLQLRTANAPFLEACSRFIGQVAKQVRDLQATVQATAGSVATLAAGASGGVIGTSSSASLAAIAGASTLGVPGGPVVLIQNEAQWTCGHDGLAAGYLGELNRYYRESGLDVPIINANDLWQGVEGEIDTWTGTGSLLPNLRQLAVVRPSQPRLVSEYRVGAPAAWGHPAPGAVDPASLQRGLAEILAAAAQFNVEPFAAGTALGFSAGRLAEGPAAFACTSDDRGAAVSETGEARASFHALRRVALFASRFARTFAHLDPKRPMVSILPSETAPVFTSPGRSAAKAGKASPLSGHEEHVVVHASGSQGSVVFIFSSGGSHTAERDPTPLLLPDGTVLPVYLGDQPVAWCLLDTRLVGRSQLDYCNLSAIALAGRVFVCSGPPGTPARLSINGAELQADVPTGDDPVVIEHEGVVVTIVNDRTLPSLHIGDDAVFMDIQGLTLAGLPMVPAWGHKFRRIGESARVEVVTADPSPPRPVVAKSLTPPPVPRGKDGRPLKIKPPKPDKKKGKGTEAVPQPVPLPPLPPNAVVVSQPKPAGKITLSAWKHAALPEYLDGSGPRFASIAGPADLNTLGAPQGYGWYRLRVKGAHAGKARVVAPASGDRLHLFLDGDRHGVLGIGPGAAADVALPLGKSEHALVVLAENMGRFAGGPNLGEGKGLFGHLFEGEPLKVGKPSLVRSNPIDVLAFKAPLWYLHPGDKTDPFRVTWSFAHSGRHPVMLTLNPGHQRGLVVVNDKPVRAFDPSGPSVIWLDEATAGRGKLTVQLAIFGSADQAINDLEFALGAYDCSANLTAKAEWAFAKWERPSLAAFSPGEKRSADRSPLWHRCTFTLAAPVSGPGGSGAAADGLAPSGPALAVDTSGLSKGQVYLDGHHLGRYFTSTADHKPVGPQTHLVIPPALLAPGREHELVIFDEHGFAPSKVRVVAVTSDH